MDRLNTKSMLYRRNLLSEQERFCPMCSSQAEETVLHLLFACNFARRCWSILNIDWPNGNSIEDLILQYMRTTALPSFLEICTIAMWELWKIRNRKVFDNEYASVRRWIHQFKDEAFLQSIRFKESTRITFVSWLNSL